MGSIATRTGPTRSGVISSFDGPVERVGAALEAALEKKWGGPLLAQAPALEGASA